MSKKYIVYAGLNDARKDDSIPNNYQMEIGNADMTLRDIVAWAFGRTRKECEQRAESICKELNRK